MKRREFITLLGGALADHAIPANAQEPVRVRTVGALIGFASDAGAKARTQAFEQSLEKEGWSVGQNLRIEYRYAEGDSARMQALANELVELRPDCVLAFSANWAPSALWDFDSRSASASEPTSRRTTIDPRTPFGRRPRRKTPFIPAKAGRWMPRRQP